MLPNQKFRHVFINFAREDGHGRKGLPMRMLPLVYLGLPYTHPNPEIQRLRFLLATEIAAGMAESDWAVFSPITQGPALEPFLPPESCLGKKRDSAWWLERDIPLLIRSDSFAVLPLKGWEESTGLLAEVAVAAMAGVSVHILGNVRVEGLSEETRALAAKYPDYACADSQGFSAFLRENYAHKDLFEQKGAGNVH